MAAASSDTAADAALPRSLDQRDHLQASGAGVWRPLHGDHRKLERTSADPLGGGAVKPAPPIALKPGTRLVREWRGVTHTVLIHADGIEWRGQRYRSLSLVARKITGARWSGPRFFGLRQRQLDSTSSARAGHGQG